MACPGSTKFLDGTPGICLRHQARLCRRESGLVPSLEPGTGRGTDHAPEIAQETDVRASSLRAASLARPPQSLIQPPHKVRMSRKKEPLGTISTAIPKYEGDPRIESREMIGMIILI